MLAKYGQTKQATINLPDHQSNSLSLLVMFLRPHLSWPIFSLPQFNSPHYRCSFVDVRNWVIFISKRMRLPRNAHPTWAPLVEPLDHWLIKATNPWQVVFPLHEIIPYVLHLTDLVESILISSWRINISISYCLHNIFKPWPGDELVQSKGSSFKHIIVLECRKHLKKVC